MAVSVSLTVRSQPVRRRFNEAGNHSDGGAATNICSSRSRKAGEALTGFVCTDRQGNSLSLLTSAAT
jgi:hypothetical protein